MKKLIFFILCILLGICMSAQVPSVFKYQAVARDASGNVLANKAVSFRISIIQGTVTGAIVYSELHTKATNAFGLVDLEVGKGTSPSGTIEGINWTVDQFFLKVEMDPAGGATFQNMGISQLLSVPFALRAKTVETEVDGDVTNEIQALSISGTNLSLSKGGGTVTLPSSGGGDNWGTQVVVPDATLAGQGTTSSPLKIAQQTAAFGQVLKWNGLTWQPDNDLVGSNLWSQNGSNIFFNTGKVGVGKDPGTDSRQFQVTGGSNVAIAAENSTTSFPTLYAKNSVASGYAGWFENISGPVARFGRNIIIADGTQGLGKVLTSDAYGATSWQTPELSPWQKIATNIYYNTGWVGIGTSNIVYPLAISNANNTCYIQLFDNQGTGGMRMGAYSGDLAFINDNMDRNMRFTLRTATDYKQIMTLVASTQRVGINTTAPPYSLSVLGGDISIHSDYTTVAANRGLRIGVSNSSGDAWVWNYENADIYFGTTNAERMRIDQTGNVGIGTNAPTQRLDVNGIARIRGMMTGVVATTVYRTSDGTLITGASDIRLKENIAPLQHSLDKVMQLKGVTFSWKADPVKKRSIGFIAQEFEKVIPQLVFTNETDGYKGINYAEVSAVLVEAIKELKAENDQLKVRLEKLEAILEVKAEK